MSSPSPSDTGPGRVVILSGPSGVGKDTLLDAWLAADPRVAKVVTTTTRPMRAGEIPGRDYNFLSGEEFLRMHASGAFLEAKDVHGNWYASPREETERLVAEGKIAVLKIDVQGAREVMAQRPDALAVFLLPPDFATLEGRIRGRALDDEPAIRRRLADARAELAEADRYHHQVVNDDLARAVEELIGLVQ